MRKKGSRHRCSLCRVETVRRRATLSRPVRHRAGGLVPVLLSGIPVERCPSCGQESADPPVRRSLLDAVARALVERPGRLEGAQIRFLRSHARLTAGRFALLLGIDPAHLSRVENGKVDSLGSSADRLARLIARPAGGRGHPRELLARLAGADPGASPGALLFRWRPKGGWASGA